MQSLYCLKNKTDGKVILFSTKASVPEGVFRYVARRYKDVLDLDTVYSLRSYNSDIIGFADDCTCAFWNGRSFVRLGVRR